MCASVLVVVRIESLNCRCQRAHQSPFFVFVFLHLCVFVFLYFCICAASSGWVTKPQVPEGCARCSWQVIPPCGALHYILLHSIPGHYNQLHICEDFADEYNVLFNCKKTVCNSESKNSDSDESESDMLIEDFDDWLCDKRNNIFNTAFILGGNYLRN